LRKNVLRTVLAVSVLALIGAASAYALKIEIDKTIVSATVDVSPRTLPARGGAPVEVSSTTRITTTDGSAPLVLTELLFMFDKHGSVDAKGLPVCTMAKLAETTVQAARKRCPGAVVGEGSGQAQVRLPGQPPKQITSPLTFFNAPPVKGMPSLIIHAYETVPTPKAVLVPVTVQRISHGRYGFQVDIQVPEIAGGYGAATLAKATIGKTWKRGGRTVGYLKAYCAGGRLQVNGKIRTSDGSVFPGTLTSPCHVGG
jgi:hypothetical protein